MRVAIVDTGIDPDHPHIPRVVDGVACEPGGRTHADWRDRLGHGTAVAAVVAWWAPNVELLAVRIFGERLACPAAVARAGFRWALEAGAEIVLLSLACTREGGWPELVAQARARQVKVIAAARNGYPDDGGAAGYPASLDGVLGVRARADSERRFTYLAGEPIQLLGPRLARPQRGRVRGLQGNSLAAAHACGYLAR